MPKAKHLFCLVLLSGFRVFAGGSDSLPVSRTHHKYLGIQINPLIQQFISFNSNASINNNPYLFSFSKNNIKTGVGSNFATGLSVNQTSSNDGVSSMNSNLVNVTFRFGYEKKYLQAEKFVPFWGIDFGAGVVYSDVTSRLNQSLTNTEFKVTTTKVFAGPSFRGGLNLALSKHIQLGTEFFFNLQVSYTEQTATNGFTTTFAPFNIGFQLPTALFLIYRI